MVKKKIKDLTENDCDLICKKNELCCLCPLFMSIKCWGINKRIDYAKSEMEVEVDE